MSSAISSARRVCTPGDLFFLILTNFSIILLLLSAQSGHYMVSSRSGDGKAQAVKAREKSSSWECQAPGLTCTELQANLTLLSAERRLPPTTPLTLDACSRKASTEQECCMDCSLPQRGPATPPTGHHELKSSLQLYCLLQLTWPLQLSWPLHLYESSSFAHLMTFLTPCSLGQFPDRDCSVASSGVSATLCTLHPCFPLLAVSKISMFPETQTHSVFLPSECKSRCWHLFCSVVTTSLNDGQVVGRGRAGLGNL